MPDYTHHIKHQLRDIITDQGGDPTVERITSVDYSNGELQVETIETTTTTAAQAAAQAIIAGAPSNNSGFFGEASIDDYHAAAFEEGGDVVVEVEEGGEVVNSWTAPMESLALIVAAGEVGPPDDTE